MEDGLNLENNNTLKMGATGNPNAARLATLQERKKTIEESLAKCNQELRQLCIQEADLTGTIPLEMPLEPGESPPSIRRRVGTAFQLPESLIKNSANKDESVSDLELQIQLHANMAEAALGLANEHNISKTLRRQHMAEYQQHKSQFNALQEKLTVLKDKGQQPVQQNSDQLHKHKKKPRPTEQDDNISVNTNLFVPFGESHLRHSMRSDRRIKTDADKDQTYSSSYPRMGYKIPNNPQVANSFPRQEDTALTRGFYRLSINGYKNYMERRENMTNIHMSSYNTYSYNQHHGSRIQLNQSPQLSPHYTHSQQTQILQQHQQQQRMSQPVYNYPTINQNYSGEPQLIKNHHGSPTSQISHSRLQHRQSSPNINTPKNYFSQNLEHYRAYPDVEQNFLVSNPHQIQPHQQYEHTSLGLGGYWKRSENEELVWCNTIDSNWQRDKRFGSLDRRKNRRLHKRISPSVDSKSATLASVPSYPDHVRAASIKSPQGIVRRSQDNKQLVRTQSLGSVGAQTIDSVFPSDDTSSCESDTRGVNDGGQGCRKPKQKEWLETSLDGPVSPTHSMISRSQSALPSVLSPEEKYVATPPQHIPPPLTPKPPLEIPAESNPSPRLPETNIEIFNNNIPKNCTIVQAGHCKPYHEETKPFEMSDFYKYSTKFKKSPIKQADDQTKKPPSGVFQRNLTESFEKTVVSPPVKNFNFSPTDQLSPGRMDNSNSSLDLSQISNANVAERFSDEMNAWYKNHKLQIENNGRGSSTSKGKSTATLV